MSGPAQFFPDEGPTPLDSQDWIDDYNETKTLGALNSTVRTPAQTEIGLFWTEHTGRQYARAFRKLASDRELSTSDSARLMAMLWAAYADAGIGCWNANSFWRPVTAIRVGGGNPALTTDPNWTPLANTPAHPELSCRSWLCHRCGVDDSCEFLWYPESTVFCRQPRHAHDAHSWQHARSVERGRTHTDLRGLSFGD